MTEDQAGIYVLERREDDSHENAIAHLDQISKGKSPEYAKAYTHEFANLRRSLNRQVAEADRAATAYATALEEA